MTPATTTEPPFLSIVQSDNNDPVLVLTVEADAILDCGHCQHLHVRVLDVAATPEAIRKFASHLRGWADRLDGVQ